MTTNGLMNAGRCALGTLPGFTLLVCGSVSCARGSAESARSLPGSPYVLDEAAPDRFPLAVSGQPVAVWVSPGDDAGVLRAAADLGEDLGAVTGTAAAVERGDSPPGTRVVLVGTLGRSALIDGLVAAGRLDASGLEGRREMFMTQIVDAPVEGLERALVIAGSDRRGTIYGIYDLSSQIGVSPWVWWADVPAARRPELHVLPGVHTRGEPAVRYRGIFINDEAPALSGWVGDRFGGFNHEFYGHVYELILRLHGNFLWPAMWGRALYDDDPENAVLASEYGIVLGTSHHEPMMRAHVEWERYGTGAWNYETNDSTLREFWRAGVERMGDGETIVTVGMRGDGDMAMSAETNIALLERIVADQRRIIGEVTGADPSSVPQAWALYKEVQDYYDSGMRVPGDVTLLFADDNWGNIRRLPDIGAAERAGGFGVYYHFDYVGGPRNYKWINTNPIARVWEQMHLAHELGANRIWIVNVGDIKPMEFPIQFFLDYAWNPDAIGAADLPAYTERFAAHQFGREHAAEIGEIITMTLKYAGRRKPELLSPETYSLVNYREADRVIEDYDALLGRARRVGSALPAHYADAYYQLVLHPVEAMANLHHLYIAAAKNRLHASQGRANTNAFADEVRARFAHDARITAFYNDTLADGKWSHMMDQTHIGYTHWQEPPFNSIPEVTEIDVPAAASMGVAIEGSTSWWPAADSVRAVLPEIDRYARQTRTIDVFNRGRESFAFTAESAEPWLRITPSSGRVEVETTLSVDVDWSAAPEGRHRVSMTIRGVDAATVTVEAVVHNPASRAQDALRGFAATDGVISMESEHYTEAVAHGGIEWLRIPDLGRTLSGMTAMPVTAASVLPGGDSPRLEYRVHVFEPARVTVRAYLSPSLDFNAPAGLRYAISFDDEAPQIVDIREDTSNRAWEISVANNILTPATSHTLSVPGEHVLKFWFVDPGVVLQKLVIDLGGLRPSYLGPPESFRSPGS